MKSIATKISNEWKVGRRHFSSARHVPVSASPVNLTNFDESAQTTSNIFVNFPSIKTVLTLQQIKHENKLSIQISFLNAHNISRNTAKAKN